MKALRFILASTAAILAVACTQKELVEKNTEGTLVFTATFENNDVKSTITDGKWAWEEGDQVLVTDGTNKETVTLAAGDITENGAVAKIKTTTIPAGAAKYFAVTPPRKYKGIVDGTDIELSAASSYTSNEIKTVIAATTGSTFAFKNVFSLLKFDTKLAFDHATMTATNIGDDRALMHVCKFNPETGEYIWGDFATVNPTLSRGENESGPYYIEFVPHALPNGFTLTLYDENDAELAAFTRSEALTPVRGHIYNIANFDKRVGIEEDPIFYESFDKCDGSGGNDDKWSGSIASSGLGDSNCDNASWTFANGYSAWACAKFGTGSKMGSATTPAISLAAGTYTLTFKAGAWDGSSEGTTLNVSATNCLLSQESVTLVKGAFTDYSIIITCASAAEVNIKFEAKNASNNRFFLDEVKIVAGGEMPDYLNVSEEEVTVACDATTASFDIESNVAWTITADTEVTLSPASGNGNATVTVSGIQPNAAASERTISTLTIAGGEGLTKTVVIKQEGDPDAIEEVTIAQFLAKEVGSTLYRISGTIDNIANAIYGNLTLTDGSNSVYVYGVKKDKDAGNQTFGELDLVAGDGLTIVCKRGEHNSEPQAQDAYQVAMVHQPRLSISPASLKFGASGGSKDITVVCKYFDGATVSATSSNTAFSTSVSGSTVTVTAASNTTPSELTGSITITATNGSTTKTGEVSVSQDAAASEATKTATYTVASVSSVDTTGDVPEGSSATFENTYINNKVQLTGGNSMTLTLSGYAGMKITGLTLSMKSNASGGAGYLSVVAGSKTLATIGSSSSGVAFNNAAWHGSYSSSFVDVTPTITAKTVGTGENLKITIGATANSLYCQSFTIEYEPSDEPIPDPVLVTGITLDKSTAELSVGGTVTLTATVNPSDATNKSLTWSSSDEAVATVDENGKVTAKGAGTANIKAKSTDGSNIESAPCVVTVTAASSSSFEWSGASGGKSTLTAMAGVQANGLGSDYAASNAPYLVKLDTTGDYIIVNVGFTISTVQLTVKMLGGATASSIKIQESSDGSTFTDNSTMAISGSQNTVVDFTTSTAFKSNSRYVKLLFTKGSNVGLGYIKITGN